MMSHSLSPLVLRAWAQAGSAGDLIDHRRLVGANHTPRTINAQERAPILLAEARIYFPIVMVKGSPPRRRKKLAWGG
jgi:hypothetical protein